MDYKYIQQLLDRYWKAETSIEEESILKAFFSQENVPDNLKKYQPLFNYVRESVEEETLGDDFDECVLGLTEGCMKVTARRITITQRLMPLFKAAAIVAILLTLGNAMQVPFNRTEPPSTSHTPAIGGGQPVAINDTVTIDSAKTGDVMTIESPSPATLK